MKPQLLSTLLAAAVLAGCSNPTPTFYKLSAEGPLPSGGGTGIGVGPVSLAEYVDRQNIVIQSGPNKIELAGNHLWAGDLDNSVARVVAINLGRRLNSGNIRTYPWQRDSEIDWQVAIDIREFIAGDDGHAHIEASWRVYSLPGSRLVKSRTFIAKDPIESEDFEAVVAAQSRLLGKLSEDIAAGIRGR
ncbi:membrane integrity-associated transporter subunit PqiC [Akkermansiaceae bacterium]|nr:membrane integrity-associated transporter subunit PqiC [Akkermansiaceae bacterium]